MAPEQLPWPAANSMWHWVQNPKILLYLTKKAYLHKGRTDLEEDRSLFAVDKSDITLRKRWWMRMFLSD